MKESKKKVLPFGKKNYILMIVGIVIIMLGLIIMSADSEPHGFGALGLTVGPIILMSGFVVELFAVLHNPHKKTAEK